MVACGYFFGGGRRKDPDHGRSKCNGSEIGTGILLERSGEKNRKKSGRKDEAKYRNSIRAMADETYK